MQIGFVVRQEYAVSAVPRTVRKRSFEIKTRKKRKRISKAAFETPMAT